MAKYKIIPSSRTIVQSPISIGHKAEKGVEAIEFDVTAWVETYGSGTLTVIMRRWGDAIPYPIALEIDENNKATWTLSGIDTAKAGMAYAQLSYIVGETVVKKSDIYTFRVMDSLTGEGEPPEAYESWLEHLQHLAAEAMAEVLDIEGIVTDKTLTVDGGIADGKATGDALALKADKSTTYTKTEVDQMIEDVEVETDTTLAIPGAPADAKATGDALSALEDQFSKETDLLKADLDESDAKLIVEPFNLNEFISNSSNYLSYDSASEIITVTAKDTRNENQLYKFPLIKGVEYAIVIDDSNAVCKFQIYDPQNRVMAYNKSISYHSAGQEVKFTPDVTGFYTLKILRDALPFTLTNLHIVNYKLWKEVNNYGVKPVFKENVDSADSINAAIFSASRHGFTSVLVPSGNYTINKSIVMRSHITLKSENNTNYFLEDQTNDFMVTNVGITTSNNHTDTNICIDGGIWDDNGSNQDKWVLDGNTKIKLVVAFWLGGVNGATIKNCKIVNSRTYGILISNSNDVDIDNVVVNVGDVNNPANSDGIHVLGPADNVKIHSCILHSEDNVVAINADDVDHGIYTTTGDISNVEISDNYIKNTDGGQGILVLSATHPVRNISIHDIKGTAGYIVNFSCFNIVPGAGGRYTNISVKNIQMDIYGNWQHAIGLYGIIRDINIENIQIRNITTTGSNRFQVLKVSKLGTCPSNVAFLNVSDIIFGENVTDNCLLYGIHVEDGCNISNAVFSKIQGKQTIAQRSSVFPFVIDGVIDKLLINRLMFNKALNGIITLGSNSSINELHINDIPYNIYVIPRIYNPSNKSINIVTISNCIDFEVPNADFINFQRCLYSNASPINHFWYKAGEIVHSTNPSRIGFRCLSDGSPFMGSWQASEAYSIGTMARIGDYVCVCVYAGTSGTDTPTIREDATFKDGTAWWAVFHKGSASFAEVSS